jgi:hypothetical protein
LATIPGAAAGKITGSSAQLTVKALFMWNNPLLFHS